MPSYKYRIYDKWYNTYSSFAEETYWYSDISACLVYDILNEKFPNRYEIHKIRIEYPIKTIG